jgi:predicted alpha/beta superfamily hydrolase
MIGWRLFLTLVATAGIVRGALAGGSEVPRQVVHFEIDYVTTFGDSVFVLGDIPELGNNQMRRAIKLVPGTFDPGPPAGLIWSVDIAIPYGTSYTWRFVVRDDSVAALSSGSNGSDITSPVAGNTPTPSPPTTDLVFYKSNAGAITEVTFNTPGGPVVVPFEPVPLNPDLLVAVMPAQPFGPGLDATINGNAVGTPLHTILRRGAQVYNYIADPAVSNVDGTREVFAVPTSNIVATRTVDSVTGRGCEVWLPRGYGEHSDRYYPVLYMHDGQNVFVPGGPFGTWAGEITAADQIKRGLVRELIIVAIDNSVNRLPEYNPHWSGSVNAQYNAFLVNELKPHIDANYRTLTGPADTGICGSSFGGIASLSAGLAFPGVFGKIGAMSTSFGYTTLDDDLAVGALPDATVLYLDSGDSGSSQDGAAATIAARDATLAAGHVLEQNFYYQIGYGQQHNEAAWSQRFDETLRALFPITDEANTIDLPLPIAGDTNGDGCVNISDLGTLLAAFGTCSGDAGYEPAADIDDSGCVNISDLGVLLANFGVGC